MAWIRVRRLPSMTSFPLTLAFPVALFSLIVLSGWAALAPAQSITNIYDELGRLRAVMDPSP